MLWLQAGSCSGDTMSLLCAGSPNLLEFIETHDVDLIWHPSLSTKTTHKLLQEIEQINKGIQPLTVLCIEGSIMLGPHNSGMYDTLMGEPKYQIIKKLAGKAQYVVAVGTCSSFGGVPAAPPNPTECTGLQFLREQKKGLLAHDWHSKAGYPVINISGCPTHPNTVIRTLIDIATGQKIELNELNQPTDGYDSLVHQGCTRNEYHEYDIEEHHFGEVGCLFFNMGCQGPYTPAKCNIDLWNNRSSKTRAGVPCMGCVSPDFPRNAALFSTKKVGDIPVTLPLGVSRPRYMAYKGLANEAAPDRVLKRKMKP